MADKKLYIHLYTSYVAATHVSIKGRILRDAPITSKDTHGILSSLFYTILRALSREIGGVEIICRYGQRSWKRVSDKEGYFEIFERITDLNDVQDEVVSVSAHKGRRAGFSESPVLNQRQDVALGIISDIDDTILVTGVKSFFKLKLLMNSLFLNPWRRKPITDAADAFHSLVNNAAGGSAPVIYLSNSPWNMYEYLLSFLNYNGFPSGILILRDMGMQLLRSREITSRNKYLEIKKILIAFQNTEFILVGDTGEIDYDIYSRILSEHPDRIRRVILNRAGKRWNERRILSGIGADARYMLVDGYTGIIRDSDS